MTNKNMVLCIYLIIGFLLYSTLSKVFERCMLNHLMFYISFHDVFAPNQYGFRSGKNTLDSLVA